MSSAHIQKYRQSGKLDTVTWGALKADDRFLAGTVMERRNHGPHDRFRKPWRVYGSDEFAQGAESLGQRVWLRKVKSTLNNGFAALTGSPRGSTPWGGRIQVPESGGAGRGELHHAINGDYVGKCRKALDRVRFNEPPCRRACRSKRSPSH